MPIYLRKTGELQDDLLIYSPALKFKPIQINGKNQEFHEFKDTMTIHEFNKYAKIQILDEIEHNTYILSDHSMLTNKQYHATAIIATCLGVSIQIIYSLRRKGFTWLDIIKNYQKLIIQQSKYRITYKGHEYASLIDLCAKLNIDYNKFKKFRETRPHKQLDDIIKEYQHGKKAIVRDHLGNTYDSQKEMCEHYDVLESVFQGRKKIGWSLEKALTTPTRSNRTKVRININPKIDHKGRKYESFTQMCHNYNLSYYTVRSRLKQGYTLKDALSKPIKKTTASQNTLKYRNKSYKSITEILLDYSISQSSYDRRKRSHPNYTFGEIIDDILQYRKRTNIK